MFTIAIHTKLQNLVKTKSPLKRDFKLSNFSLSQNVGHGCHSGCMQAALINIVHEIVLSLLGEVRKLNCNLPFQHVLLFKSILINIILQIYEIKPKIFLCILIFLTCNDRLKKYIQVYCIRRYSITIFHKLCYFYNLHISCYKFLNVNEIRVI